MAYKHDGSTVDPFGYDIKYLLLISEEGEIDLTYLFKELNIHEDIYAKCITGNILVEDALNLISNLPIMEGDRIKGHFTRSMTDPYVTEYDPLELEFNFEIVKINKHEKVQQDSQIWSLSFVSTTWTDNLHGRISKSYSQMPYSDMVVDVYDRWLSKGGLRGELDIKKLQVTPTDMLWNIVIPNIKPYDAITFLSRRSFLGNYTNYLFWEDRDNFNYKPLSGLMEKEHVAEYATATADEVADVHGNPNPEFLKSQYLNIIAMKRLEYHDITKAAMSGMINNRLIKHDIFHKRITDHTSMGGTAPNYRLGAKYAYTEEFDNLPHTEQNSLTKTKLIKERTSELLSSDDSSTIISFAPEHSWQWEEQPSFNHELWMRQRRGQLAQLEFVKLQITTPGSMTRKVGEKILINMYSPEWKVKGLSDQRPKLDSRFAGNYMITVIRRKFTKDNFSCIMEVIRDDYVKLEKDPIWEEAAGPDFGSRTSIPGGRGGM